MRFFCAFPHPCTLDINADEVLLRIHLSQAYGIFSLAAAQFKNDRIIVSEPVTVPFSFELEITPENIIKQRLYNMVKAFHLSPPCQFVLAQDPRDLY